MSTIRKFEDIEAWQTARELANLVYEATCEPGFNRDFALRDQIRRAAISIVSNIAEGYERDGDREFVQFLYIAKGSAGEVRAQLYLALDRNYLTNERFQVLFDNVTTLSRMLFGLIRYLQRSELTGTKYKQFS
jgi:four helix bundle protein